VSKPQQQALASLFMSVIRLAPNTVAGMSIIIAKAREMNFMPTE